MRDLDFGSSFVRIAEGLEWPEATVVEDLSHAAHLVLHRFQELQPAKLVLVGAVARGTSPPGTVRRSRVGLLPPTPAQVHDGLCDGARGSVGIDHTLAVLRHWGCLPADAVVIEVEPADTSFGVGFSAELGDAVDAILSIVGEELSEEVEPAPRLAPRPGAGAPGLEQLLDYTRAFQHSRGLQSLEDDLPPSSGLAVAARFRPWGAGLRLGGDWFDVFPTGDALVGVVMGDAGGCGAQEATAMAQLATAVRAFALLEGDRPDRVVHHLSQLLRETGGADARLVYLTVDVPRGRVVVAGSGSGQPRPLLLPSTGGKRFVDVGLEGATVPVDRDDTLLLYSDGLVHDQPGLGRLRRAATTGPSDLGALCDHIMDACLDGRDRGDDASLVALRVLAG